MQNTIIKRMSEIFFNFDSHLDYRIFSEHSQYKNAIFSEPNNEERSGWSGSQKYL